MENGGKFTQRQAQVQSSDSIISQGLRISDSTTRHSIGEEKVAQQENQSGLSRADWIEIIMGIQKDVIRILEAEKIPEYIINSVRDRFAEVTDTHE